MKTEHQLQPYQEILNKLRQRIQHHTLEKFEELSHNDALAGFQTFKTFYGPEILLNQYSRWKEKKYQILSRIGIASYQKKAEFQKKLALLINLNNKQPN